MTRGPDQARQGLQSGPQCSSRKFKIQIWDEKLAFSANSTKRQTQ